MTGTSKLQKKGRGRPRQSGKLLSPEEVAPRYGVTARTVRLWIEKKRIPAEKLGRAWRIREGNLPKVAPKEEL